MSTSKLASRHMTTTTEPLTLCTQENGIRRIVLNNPAKRNALSCKMMESLRENILNDVKDLDLRVIVISANGPAFCAGHDLKELVSIKKRSEHAKLFRMCSDIMGDHPGHPRACYCTSGRHSYRCRLPTSGELRHGCGVRESYVLRSGSKHRSVLLHASGGAREISSTEASVGHVAYWGCD
uniref:3-hydroxyisobutyryl-CoA hydrolase n=1 Tax=Ciona savignyi TaxID=51511 RepID=H2Z928_CIOSA